MDLGEEWEDTNIDDCLEHLGDSGGGGGDHDRVGLREFVVMLAVGRVCRPQKRVSFFLRLVWLCLRPVPSLPVIEPLSSTCTVVYKYIALLLSTFSIFYIAARLAC